MDSIELRVTLLAGFMGGALLVLGEAIALHRKMAGYRDHLRELYRRGRFLRLLSEVFGILFVALIQPVAVSWLLLGAMDNFNPKFSQHAMQELKQTIHNGRLPDDAPPQRWHQPGML
ncbi:MAG: hypothetical protein GC139_09465 [Sideroxydans sp.]|nr:hypothetical protein [Sideroxydans sp.]